MANLKVVGADKLIDIDLVEPNPWNPNVQSDFDYSKMLASMRRFGFVDPLHVRSGREKGALFAKKQILGGAHRWKGAKELGLKQIPVRDLGRMSDAEAKVLTDILNNTRGKNDPLKLAELIDGVLKAPDTSQLVELLPYTPDEMERIMQPLRPADVLPEPDEEDGDDSKPRPNNDRLFKRFMVSIPEPLHTRALDLLRRIKASRKVDADVVAFEALLDLAEGALKSKQSTPPPPNLPLRRRVGT